MHFREMNNICAFGFSDDIHGKEISLFVLRSCFILDIFVGKKSDPLLKIELSIFYIKPLPTLSDFNKFSPFISSPTASIHCGLSMNVIHG